jgi:tetratricopeptide (TPR) repeat protein
MLLLPLQSLGFSPYDAKACWERGREAQKRGDLKEADGWFERAADLFPARADLQLETGLWFWGGWTDLGEQSYLDRSARCLGRYFERHPGKLESVMELIWDPKRPLGEYEALVPKAPLARAAFAGSLVARGRWKRGMEIFEQGCPATEEHAKAYDAFAGHLRRAGQWGMEAAVRDRRLAALSDARAYAASAQAWMRLGAPKEAAKRLETAARIDPGNAAWHAQLAEARRAGGERAGALEAYTEAVRLDPSYRARRAAFYEELGLPEEAAKDWEAAGRPDRAKALRKD